MAAEGARRETFAGCRGLVLMGGRSARFGRDKAWVEVEGEPLWMRQMRLLRTRVGGVWRALPYGSSGEPEDFVDPVPYPGPWWAIRAALARLDAQSPWLLVLAVDLPCPPPELLDRLWAGRLPGGIALPVDGSVRQPLLAVWHRDVLDRTADLPPVGMPVHRVIERVPLRLLPLTGDETRWLHNLNTPADLEGLGTSPKWRRRQGPDPP